MRNIYKYYAYEVDAVKQPTTRIKKSSITKNRIHFSNGKFERINENENPYHCS